MTDNIRAALERLIKLDDFHIKYVANEGDRLGWKAWTDAITAARAALAAAPEGEPSDEELALIYHDCCGGCEFMDQGGFEDAARAILSRWGRPAAPPAPLEGEVAELALKELERTVVLLMPVTGHKKIKRFDTIRAALKRLQELENKADLNPAPVPAEREVGELVNLLAMGGDRGIVAKLSPEQCRRAAILLKQLSAAAQAVVPVAVTERLPGQGDCDAEGRCWIFMPDIGTAPSWRLADPRDIGPCHTHWLPAHALPLPAPQGGEVEG